MGRKTSLWIFAPLVPITFGSGPCYCDGPPECDLCNEQRCEGSTVSECVCSGSSGRHELVVVDDCGAAGSSCTPIREARTEDEFDSGFAACIDPERLRAVARAVRDLCRRDRLPR
jgi:hypothetical protein